MNLKIRNLRAFSSVKKEIFDSPEVLDEKIKILANMISNSKHAIAFTGAGISTSAGIADYRSTEDTVMPTGPGKWEEKGAEGLTFEQWASRESKYKRTDTVKALPTYSHMALSTLLDQNRLKYIVSQNIDGLHRKSGVLSSQLAELHGNTNLEICQKCGKDYLRDFSTRSDNPTTVGVRNGEYVDIFDHRTGRTCDNHSCGGELHDSIVNFGEPLDPVCMASAQQHAQDADLCLALGSSLQVMPACYIPQITKQKGGDLVIVNLQPTPMDSIASLRINAQVDEVMKAAMVMLGVEVPKFELKRFFAFDPDTKTVTGLDEELSPFDIFRKSSVLE